MTDMTDVRSVVVPLGLHVVLGTVGAGVEWMM